MSVRPSSYSCADTTLLNIAALRMPLTTPATKAAQLHGAAPMYLRAMGAGAETHLRGRAAGLLSRVKNPALLGLPADLLDGLLLGHYWMHVLTSGVLSTIMNSSSCSTDFSSESAVACTSTVDVRALLTGHARHRFSLARAIGGRGRRGAHPKEHFPHVGGDKLEYSEHPRLALVRLISMRRQLKHAPSDALARVLQSARQGNAVCRPAAGGRGAAHLACS